MGTSKKGRTDISQEQNIDLKYEKVQLEMALQDLRKVVRNNAMGVTVRGQELIFYRLKDGQAGKNCLAMDIRKLME